MQSVFVFRSDGRDTAFERALTLGRQLEQVYRNAAGEEVRWRLARIVTLDELETTDIDGCEVYSEAADLDSSELVGYDAGFEPDLHPPTQTGV